jgi:hypothetical protein
VNVTTTAHELGDLVVAAFEEAAHHSADPREVSRLATKAVVRMLRGGRTRVRSLEAGDARWEGLYQLAIDACVEDAGLTSLPTERDAIDRWESDGGRVKRVERRRIQSRLRVAKV